MDSIKKFQFNQPKYLEESKYEKQGHNQQKFNEYNENEDELGFSIIDSQTN